MKKTTLLLLLFIICFVCISCMQNDISIKTNGVATQSDFVVSPSGDYILCVIDSKQENYTAKNFYVLPWGEEKDLSIEPEYISNEYFNSRHQLYFFWDEFDNIWVYSGDIGDAVWGKKDVSNWEVIENKNYEKYPVPNLLKDLVPKLYN